MCCCVKCGWVGGWVGVLLCGCGCVAVWSVCCCVGVECWYIGGCGCGCGVLVYRCVWVCCCVSGWVGGCQFDSSVS